MGHVTSFLLSKHDKTCDIIVECISAIWRVELSLNANRIQR